MTLVTHLWQSTLCVGLAAVLAALFRRAAARTRHAIWVTASIKFLVPFSLFAAAGSYIGGWTAPLATPSVSVAIRWIDQTMSLWNLDVRATEGAGSTLAAGLAAAWLPALLLVWASGAATLTLWRWRQWRTVSDVRRRATPLEDGREAEALRRVTVGCARPQRIGLRRCESTLEPGILGIVRPALLWPAGLSGRLTDAELDAVLAHEVCHVERRDNLTASVQMLVETLFWFFPPVWWVGARLVIEREHACDEGVLTMSADKRHYAEAILKVCDFCLRSPLACVAGVGGANLSRRIERIMTGSTPKALSRPARLLLAGVLGLVMAAPVAVGALNVSIAGPDGPQPSASNASAISQNDHPVYRVGNGITAPKVVKEVHPVYTKAAMDAKIQGTVTMEATVLEDGTADDVKVIRSLDTEHGLDESAMTALKQWRFEPGRKDDKPVAVRVEVEMSFTLK